MAPDLYWLLPSFFAVAMVYSMAGFGGGSSYLALLVLSSLDYQSFAPISLCCNIVVSLGGFLHFVKEGHFRWRQLLPFLTAVPAAYAGGRIPVSQEVFMLLLALSLLAAGVRLFASESRESLIRRMPSILLWGPILGAILGFWSGIVGIGGGIFLAPLLILTGWANAKEAAASASGFILINSIAGLAARSSTGLPEASIIFSLVFAVLVGGQIGSRLGSTSFSRLAVQRITAVLIVSVGVRLLWSFVTLS